MRIPKIVSTNSADVVREDTYKLGYFDEISMISETWKQDEKELDKYIKKIERIVRGSYEYKEYVKFLKDEIDMNQCAFLPKLSREDVSLEIHHAPFTLYDITAIILNEARINYAGEITPFLIAERVMKAHFDGLVGLIPLSITVHQLVHKGDIFVPLDYVHGDIKGFYTKYKDYLTEDQKNVLAKNVQETSLLNKEKYSPTVLERRYTYLEVDGMEFVKPIEIEQEDLQNVDLDEAIGLEDIA